MVPAKFSTLAHYVQSHAEQMPHATAFRWFNDIDRIDTLTWERLHERARAIATAIRSRSTSTQVILCVPQGFAFIEAIFGVFYAGCTAVPVYPPDSARALPRFLHICADAQARLIITTRVLAQKLEKFGADLSALPLLFLDEIATDATVDIELPDAEDLALLQYTSGTTATPKGVMISHRHVIENERAATLAYRLGDVPHLVSWLPFYHDFGLIGGIFFPVFNGIPATLLSPATFLRNPSTWLRIMSDTRATISGAPNFAFELCAKRIGEDIIDTLDLSQWQTAVCGAEMIRQSTVDTFISRFARAGFAASSFCAAYGMAEATLYVASAHYEGPQFETPARGATAFANCGNTRMGEVAIVDPNTKQRLPDNTVGEIWIKTPSIAHGYWRQESLTQQTFDVATADGDSGYFRSGDLGFLCNGNLHITGRLKELIILRGKNFSPQEIETIARASNPAFDSMQCAAFSIDRENGGGATEKLVIVQEVNRRLLNEQPLAHLQADIRLALRGALAVEPDDIVLVKHNSLPRTSSGKLQRTQIRALYRDGVLTYLTVESNTEAV